MFRSYSELLRLETFSERYKYLELNGIVGDSTFGFDRWMNQAFYHSREWKRVRDQVIVRDNGSDLGIDGYEIHSRLYIHHLNPMTVANLREGDEVVLDPEYLITTTLRTHNAIHYGDERKLAQPLVPRHVGDTKLW